MPSLKQPLPPEELPPGWGSVDVGDEQITYRRHAPPITLRAVRVPSDQSHPSLGLCRCWELRYCYSIGECSATETLGRVSTRTAALDALLECMHHVHDSVDSLEDPHDVRSALESVSLPSQIPE